MSQTAVLRATSLATSGLLLAAIAIAGLTMSITLNTDESPPSGPSVTMVTPQVEPPPRPIERPRVQLPPIDDAAEPTRTELLPIEPMEELVEIDTGPVVADPLTMITRPSWVRTPRNLQDYYPPRALARNIEGDVLLNCIVRVTGALDCAIVSETPTGWAFGTAAQRIARDYRMVPATRDGVAVEGRYVMRVPFRLD